MREDTKAELDIFLEKKEKIARERKEFRARELETHLKFLEAFGSVQDLVIRPMMQNFGKYLENQGHRYFIEASQELIDGYLHPTSRITLHLFLDDHPVVPSFSFRADNSKTVCVFKKTGTTNAAAQAVGRYELQAITREFVETHLKEFIIESVMS